MNYNRVIIHLDGTSSALVEYDQILDNIIHALRLLQLPFEIYESHNEGFKKLKDDMNQDNVLYILNDSLQYHLCEKPCIIISRSTPWVMSSAKPNCIGRLTQEMIQINITCLMAIIYRNKQMRQEFDGKSAFTHLICNTYESDKLETIGRFGIAAYSWHITSLSDIHLKINFITDDDAKDLPRVNEILKQGLELCEHPDDIVVMVNRDICLVKEATGIIRAFMDSQDIDACYAHRVDIKYTGLLQFKDLIGRQGYSGIDLFAFRANAKCLKEILSTDLLLARVGWDSFWASKIEYRVPFNICYHFPHNNEWTTDKGNDGNIFNLTSIANAGGLEVDYFNGAACFEKIK